MTKLNKSGVSTPPCFPPLLKSHVQYPYRQVLADKQGDKNVFNFPDFDKQIEPAGRCERWKSDTEIQSPHVPCLQGRNVAGSSIL